MDRKNVGRHGNMGDSDTISLPLLLSSRACWFNTCVGVRMRVCICKCMYIFADANMSNAIYFCKLEPCATLAISCWDRILCYAIFFSLETK